MATHSSILTGESHRQRNLMGYTVHEVAKSQTLLKTHTHTHTHIYIGVYVCVYIYVYIMYSKSNCK